MVKLTIKGKAKFEESCEGDQYYSIGEESRVGYCRSLEIDNWPEEFFDFIEKNKGKDIQVTIKMKVKCDHDWIDTPTLGRGMYVRCSKCSDRGPKFLRVKQNGN